MRPADVIYKAINHEEQDIIPIEAIRGTQDIIPIEDRETTSTSYGTLALDDYKSAFGFHFLANEKKRLSALQANGNSMVGVPTSFGCIYMEKVVSYKGQTVYRSQYGSLIYIRDYPDYTRRIISQAVRWPEDLDHIKILRCDEVDPKGFSHVVKHVKYWREQGYFQTGSMKGPFDASWYFLRNFNPWLADLVRATRGSSEDKDFVKRCIDLVCETQVENLKLLVEAGMDMVNVSEDLGEWDHPFISPQTYLEFIYPWHKKIVDTFHKMGIFVQLHSHGQINPLLPHMVDAGFDVINPFDPGDHMDLAEVKEKYGDKITISTIPGFDPWEKISSWDEVRKRIVDRVKIGSPGGGFIFSASLPYEGSRITRSAFSKRGEDRGQPVTDPDTWWDFIQKLRKWHGIR